ncbi:MAG: hypothetical protein KH921_14390 [Erysipelotrichaceae bacterium]|nr:hypothetical protein [Erysipelotrichaceae bacterium]
MYVVLSYGVIGRISKVCTCEECKKRGETELFIEDLNGDYLDCIKYHDLFNRNVVLNIGAKLEDLTISHSNEEMNKVVADLYQGELLRSDRERRRV